MWELIGMLGSLLVVGVTILAMVALPVAALVGLWWLCR